MKREKPGAEKIVGGFMIGIAVVGFALAAYQYAIGRGRIPTILFSTMLLLFGIRLLKPKKPE